MKCSGEASESLQRIVETRRQQMDLNEPCSPRGLLRLPSEIRTRIYRYAGLVPDSDIALGQCSREVDSYQRTDLRTCYALMLTCKRLYDDIAPDLYSKHRFFFRPQCIDDLKILFSLRPSTLKHLASLTVRLDLAPYQHCHCHFKPRRLETDREEQPFAIPATQQRAFLALWCTGLTRILDHVTPNRLNFHLVCDMKSYEAAALATRPLAQVNYLADCSIRFGSHRDRLLADLAREVVRHATKQTPDQQQPFRYLELPSEVRQQILENTDLVTPLCEAEWNPTDGFYLRYQHLEGYMLGSES